MNKKTAGFGLCMLLASSIVLADNPFGNNSVVLDKSESDDSLASVNVTVSEEKEAKETKKANTSADTKTSQYTVVVGDYLFSIARKLLGDGNRWPELVELNKDRYPSLISNPEMIYAGWVLTIPGGNVSDSTSSSNIASNNNGNTGSSNSNTSSTLGNTQASEFYELGNRAYNEYLPYTEDSARGEWIRKVGAIVKNTNTYGIKKSLIIAQIINESGWMSKGQPGVSNLADYNNIVAINTDMGRVKPEMQSSTWAKKRTSGVEKVCQWNSDGTQVVDSYESMRHYDSIEESIEDYAKDESLYHPECVGSNNLEDYRSFLEGDTPNPNASTTDKYRDLIAKYNLERFDE